MLYYNSEVWLIPPLNQVQCKKKLLTTSSNALKVTCKYWFPFIIYKDSHKLANRATPKMFLNYQLALLLFNMYNSDESEEWVHLSLNQVLTSSQASFNINKNNNLLVGMKATSNCLY
jgi:hypothetical protein